MATIFCDPSASGSDDGTSWEDAYTSLQTAIDNAGSGDEVWVKGRTITLSARIDFDNSNANAIYGGFDTALTGTNGSVSGRDLPSDITILDGGDSYQCGYVNNVAYTIDGFRFYDGAITGNGAGLGVYLTSGTVKIENCEFDSCAATSNGGGLYLSGNGAVDVDNSTFTGNSATTTGGAFYLSSSDGTFDDCTFTSNSSAGWAVGAIIGSGYSLIYTDCTMSSNTSSAYNGADTGAGSAATITGIRCIMKGHSGGTIGGAIRTTGSNSTWANCVITGNSCGYGGGMYLSGGTHTITNCTVADNTASSAGDGIRNTSSANTTIVNSIFWGSNSQIANAATLTITYSDIQQSSGTYTGTGNVNDDPLFLGSGDDPYDLDGSSEAVDSGNASATNYPANDYLGRARVDDPDTTNTGAGTPAYSDMGAYEYQAATVAARPAMLLGY